MSAGELSEARLLDEVRWEDIPRSPDCPVCAKPSTVALEDADAEELEQLLARLRDPH